MIVVFQPINLLKMRKTFLWFVLTAFLNLSCQESFFNELPSDQLTEDLFFSNKDDLESILYDAYFRLRTAYANQYVIGDVASDNAYNSKLNNNNDRISINESNVTATNGVVQSIWTGSYYVIARANLVLDRIENVNLSEKDRNQLKGEALFLRSLIYFNLVRIFGDVPLVLKDIASADEAFSYKRDPVEKVYAQIINDLANAESWLPASYTNNRDAGRATSIAAKSLLGDIYLTRKEYDKAASEFSEIVNSGSAALLEDYSAVFDSRNANNREIIFAVQYARDLDPSQGNPLVSHAWPNESVGTGLLRLGQGYFLMTDDLADAFEQGDKRKVMNNYDFVTGYSRKYVFTRKYYDNQMTVKVESGNDWIIYRYADILLKYSEALNEAGNTAAAFDHLSAVRRRAGLSSDPVWATSQGAMRVAIEKERRVELNCEGHRWFDLLRTGRLREVMNAHFQNKMLDNHQIGAGASVEEFELLFPVPLFEINLNPDNLNQNPGYH